MADTSKKQPKLQQLPVLSEASNRAVVHMDGRKFPGLVLQGDSLLNLLLASQRIGTRLKELTDGGDDALWAAQELSDNLLSLVLHYQNVLEQYGIEPPYPSRASIADRQLLVDDLESEEGPAG